MLMSFVQWQSDKALVILGCFPLLKNVLSIDFSLFWGLSFVFLAGIIIEKFTKFESSGFIAGATAFQIIIAGILFEPSSLNIDKNCLISSHDTIEKV
jgi:predicted ABC-type exoprotein transport system permease subunit